MKLKPLSSRLSIVLVILILILAACNGGSDSDESASSTAAATPATQTEASEPETAETDASEVEAVEAADAEVADAEAAAPVTPPAPVATASCDSGDAGSAEDPCVISTATQLQEIDSNRSGHYALGSDIDASETSSWNDGAGFSPISSFSGSLDGRDFTISGLVINRPDGMNVGLFGDAQDEASIRNISLLDAQVTGTMFVGALVGNLRGGEISRAHVNADVSGDGWVGGLVGSLQAGAEVRESSASGSVTGSEERIGGLVGQNAGSVSQSFSLSSVQGGVAVGGLVGRSSGSITDSYSIVGASDDEEASLSGNHGTNQIGGLVGVIEASAIIGNSYTVSFSGSSNTVDFIGFRLVGHAWGTGEGLSESYYGGNQAIPLDSTDGARKLEDMMVAENYVGWDFADVWSIDEGEDYPDLVSNSRR